jgi:hypothetical protein
MLLVAGGAMAQGQSKKKQTASVPESPLTEADRPKTCDDQCNVMEKIMVEPCKKGSGGNKQAQQMCSNNAKQVVDACRGSCKDLGRIDKEYVLDRIKPPAGYKAAKEGDAKGGATEEAHGDQH